MRAKYSYLQLKRIEKSINFTAHGLGFRRINESSYEVSVYNGVEAEVEIPSMLCGAAVKRIGYCAFEKRHEIKSITLASSIGEVGEWAFCECVNLGSVVIGKGIKSIGEGAFCECVNLIRIVFEGTVREWNSVYKDSGWDYNTGNYTVKCADGLITKDGTVAR